MKKLFLLLPIAALLLASCSTDEQNIESQVQKAPEGAIWFSSGLLETTRATFTIDNFTKFKVTGLHSTNGFENLLVTKTGNLWAYTGGETPEYKYWPSDNSSIDFFAYAPETLTGMEITSLQKTMTGFTQTQRVAEHVDVLTAYTSGNKTANASSGVAMPFKHALSQIEVRAKCSDAQYTVKVLGVKLCRVKNTGDMAFQTASDEYPVWSNQDGKNSYIVEGETALTMTSSAQSVMFGSDNFLMVPQQLTAWTGSESDENGAYLSVLCQIIKGSDQIFPYTAGKYSFTSVPISTKWEPGHKYVYTLDFFGAGGGAGQYDPEPTNPDNPPLQEGDEGYDPDQPGNGNGEVNIDDDPTGQNDPDNPNHGNEPSSGDPIIPDAQVALKFTVTITDWINGEGDNEKLDL